MTVDLTEFALEREFIGYGYNTPDPKWPNNAKIAVNFIIQHFVGSEKSVEEGDDTFDVYLMDMQMPGVPWSKNDFRDDLAESQYDYGTRVGVPRLLEMFKKKDLPSTWNLYSRALEKSPYWTKAIVESGNELTLGGKRWIDYLHVPAEVENEHLRESIDKFQELTGKVPNGFFTDRRSNSTVKLYAQAMADKGYPLLYSSDSCSDDLPFWTPSPVAGDHQGLLMLPFSYDVSDVKFNLTHKGFASPKDYFDHLMDTFECLYEEGVDGEAKMMTIVLHPHIIGRAGRLHWLEKFVDHLKATPGVWVARREEIAEHFASVYPYDAKTAFGQTPVVPDIKYPGPGKW